MHPRFKTRIRRQPDVAEAFYWQDEPRSLKEKYGKAEPQVRQLFTDFTEWLEASKLSKGQALRHTARTA